MPRKCLCSGALLGIIVLCLGYLDGVTAITPGNLAVKSGTTFNVTCELAQVVTFWFINTTTTFLNCTRNVTFNHCDTALYDFNEGNLTVKSIQSAAVITCGNSTLYINESIAVAIVGDITCGSNQTVSNGTSVQLDCTLPYSTYYKPGSFQYLPFLSWKDNTQADLRTVTDNVTTLGQDINNTFNVMVTKDTIFNCSAYFNPISIPNFATNIPTLPASSSYCITSINITVAANATATNQTESFQLTKGETAAVAVATAATATTMVATQATADPDYCCDPEW